MHTNLSTAVGAELKPRQSISRRWRWITRGLLGLLGLIIILVLVGATYQATAVAVEARAYPPRGQLVDVGGHRLHLYCVGTGSPTVVLENGLGTTSPTWQLVQPVVGQTTRVCSYDRAGFGWSEAGPEPRTSQRIAQELHTLLAAGGITGPFILAGHSAGGMHVQVYASQYPDDVVGLVLIDATPAQLMASFSPSDRQALLPPTSQLRLMQVLQPLGLMRLLPLPGAEALASLPVAVQGEVKALNMRPGMPVALYAEAIAMETNILQTAAASPFHADRPLLVLFRGIPAEPLALEPKAKAAMQELTQRSSNGKFVVAENSGHSIMLDRPDVVNEALHEIIAAVRTGQRLTR